MSPPALRRLIKLPGVDDLEFQALKKPRMAEPDALAEFPEIGECIKANFGLTPEEAEAAKPGDWDGIDEKAPLRQVEAFEAAGWDVTDDRKRPLRLLGHFAPALWLAIRGVAGSLPAEAWVPEKDTSSAWGASMQADATKFRKDRR
jgi:hypothetical protein